ncbi:MAG: hypothetical protein NZ954_03790 [Thermofilaceae archaeon]|nr:hypothetical protein [Thermofilaceae archaeon]MCX8181306.1 hypothetical protein [Thermofilaceae archaeon]MDW8004649.1 radical SAM protein [Thermofilaceae archaeon]
MSEKLSFERVERAKEDYHARKPPVHCGITVHSVIGCTYKCSYCYLPEMGIAFSKAQPYGLGGEDITLSLLFNPSFIPGLLGTYIALGSIGEPFHPVGAWRTLEYIETFSRLLGNPIQFSTKAILDDHVAKRLLQARGSPINPLVTIVTLQHNEKIEPVAPSPVRRLETIANLRKSGLYPMLFLRPLIPDLQDSTELLRESKNSGATAVVFGGLRVTPSIIARLASVGVDTSQILNRVKGQLRDGIQISVQSQDLKEHLAEEARRIGLTPLFSACCANTLNIYLAKGVRVPCAGLCFVEGQFCAKCPVNCQSIKVEVDPDEIKWAVKEFLNVDVSRVDFSSSRIFLYATNPKHVERRLRVHKGIRAFLETAYRKKFYVEQG